MFATLPQILEARWHFRVPLTQRPTKAQRKNATRSETNRIRIANRESSRSIYKIQRYNATLNELFSGLLLLTFQPYKTYTRRHIPWSDLIWSSWLKTILARPSASNVSRRRRRERELYMYNWNRVSIFITIWWFDDWMTWRPPDGCALEWSWAKTEGIDSCLISRLRSSHLNAHTLLQINSTLQTQEYAKKNMKKNYQDARIN